MMDLIALLEKLGSDCTSLRAEHLQTLLEESNLNEDVKKLIQQQDLKGLANKLAINESIICCAQVAPDEDEPDADKQPKDDEAINR